MKIPKEELALVLVQFNPWWNDGINFDVPLWHRTPFKEIFSWVYEQPVSRAVLLSGARQVGKTTLLLQVIKELLQKGVPAANIAYVTFDHPIIKLAGIDAVLEAWRAREPHAGGIEYLFLDEAQFIDDWGTWIKHQVDFVKNRRIVFTGSSMPLTNTKQESGVGRWYTIRLATLSFYEYLQLRNLSLPKLPQPNSLYEIFNWSPTEFTKIIDLAAPYLGHFHEYLIRGGFPQTAMIDNINQGQRLLREDIVDKALRRDMTALFGVRRVVDLELTFLYLCLHDGGLLDMQSLTSNLGVKRPTAQHFIELLEAVHLIYRLYPFGYGKDILRAKYKIYLADSAIAPAILLKGKELLDNPKVLSIAAETAVFKNLFSEYQTQNARFTYWRGTKDQEVDIVMEIGGQIIPFEVKYRSQPALTDLKGLFELCKVKPIKHGYVVTKSVNDFGLLAGAGTKILKIPACLLCYWISNPRFASPIISAQN